MAKLGGLDKDGGISFTRKPKTDEEKPVEEVKQEKGISEEEIAKMQRLGAKLSQAKRINAGGFAINGSAIISMLFYIDSLLLDPSTVEALNVINDLADTDIDFEQIIARIQGYKAQIIGVCVTTQTMIMQYKNTVQKMKNEGNESFYDIFNKQLEEVGF